MAKLKRILVLIYMISIKHGEISLLAKVPWSNVPDTDDQGDWGVSFSPDNSKAYFTNVRDGSTSLYQYDLNTNIITLLFTRSIP